MRGRFHPHVFCNQDWKVYTMKYLSSNGVRKGRCADGGTENENILLQRVYIQVPSLELLAKAQRIFYINITSFL